VGIEPQFGRPYIHPLALKEMGAGSARSDGSLEDFRNEFELAPFRKMRNGFRFNDRYP